MSMLEIFSVAFFCMSVVFAVLGSLYILLRVFAGVVKLIEKPK